MKRILLTLVCSMAIIMNLNAATITWDNGGDGVNWNDALNWDTDALPTVMDDVIIEDEMVILNINTTVQRVFVGGSGTLTIESGLILTVELKISRCSFIT